MPCLFQLFARLPASPNRAGEILGLMLLTWHNLHYYQELMQGIRDAISTGTFDAFEADFHSAREQGDIEPH